MEEGKKRMVAQRKQARNKEEKKESRSGSAADYGSPGYSLTGRSTGRAIGLVYPYEEVIGLLYSYSRDDKTSPLCRSNRHHDGAVLGAASGILADLSREL
jgi:hypothetical protein